tara:strand:- start:469 stop:756 length:288 start_codon:yes stop_codon:yes gene_type:complete
MRRIIINKKPTGLKPAHTKRIRTRGATKEQKRIAKLGRVGMFEFSFATIKDDPGSEASVAKAIRVDSYDDAIFYAHLNTPAGHQGLIDGLSVVTK